MPEIRKIVKLIKSKPVIEGAGVHLKRVFGFHEPHDTDPFLLLDDFRGDDPALYRAGFPWHPHRGIETITYVLRGVVEHGDSMGNTGVIARGDVQWMTAGSGIIHQEMPAGDASGVLEGFQLWSNLPASHKMMPPRYQEVKEAEIPVVRLASGAEVRVICGVVDGVAGPVKDIVTAPEYLDVSLPAHSEFVHDVPADHTVFAYVIGGQGVFCHERDAFAYETQPANYFDLQRDSRIGNTSLVLFGAGDQVVVSTGDEPVRFLLISGRPLKEPVAWYGPIVMNTQAELRLAFDELQKGTFLKQ